MATAVRVENLDDTIRDLRRLGVDMLDIKEAFHRIAKVAERATKNQVPVRSGAMRQSVRAAKLRNRALVRVGYSKRVPYAGVQNYGTPEGRTAMPKNINAQHYVKRVDAVVGPQAYRLLEDEIDDLIRSRGLH